MLGFVQGAMRGWLAPLERQQDDALARVAKHASRCRAGGNEERAPAASFPAFCLPTAGHVRLAGGCDQGGAGKTWATAPRLNAGGLTGSVVSGMGKGRPPPPRMTGRGTERDP